MGSTAATLTSDIPPPHPDNFSLMQRPGRAYTNLDGDIDVRAARFVNTGPRIDAKPLSGAQESLWHTKPE